MTKFSGKKVSGEFLLTGGIIILPFLLFYWMVPFVSGHMLGSDYINYHVYHQLDLLFSIKSGSFPLYAPACYYGQSSTYPHAQLYHPVIYLASLMPAFWQGYSLEWLTLFRLLSLAACHLLLYRFLKKIGLKTPAAWLISLVTVYNLAMLALFWNAVALESYTGTLFLCVAIGWYYLEPERRFGTILVVLATYWLITADFPPYVFYGIVGAIIFTLTMPFLRVAVGGDPPDRRRLLVFWGSVAGCFLAGVLLSAAYLLPFFLDYLWTSSGRIDQPYLWATQWTDTLAGFMNNFFNPLGAGFSMFGGTPLFLAAVLAPVTALPARRKVPGVIWALWGVVIICFCYMQGEGTPVHRWAWEYIPLVSALRGPVRIGMILPLLFMMILVWLAGGRAASPEDGRDNRFSRPLVTAAAAALALTVLYAWLPESLTGNPHYACPYNIRAIPDWVKPVILFTSAVILGLIICRCGLRRRKTAPALMLLLLALTICQLVVVLRYGPYAIETRQKTPTWQHLSEQKQAAINFQPVFFLNQHAGSRTVVRQLQNYFMEPRLAKIYRKYQVAGDLEGVYRRLNGDRREDEVVLEKYRPENEGTDRSEARADIPDGVKLDYSSYNRLVFSARARQAGFFVFAYPFSGNWQARLNGQPTRIYRANGAAQAVALPPGEHRLEFRYHSPAALAGMVISCLVLALLGGLAGFKISNKPAGYFVAVAVSLGAAGIFCLWYTSLYTGDNLETRYAWQTPAPDAPVNLAFGKPTRMSSHTPGYPYRYNSRHAVDGGRGVDSCFFTDEENNPWWMVDLESPRPVGAVVLFTGFPGQRLNTPPLTLSVSMDGRRWQPVAIEQFDAGGRATVVFDPPRRTRYVKVRASGKTVLSLNEVEIYRRPGTGIN
ncbi:MAG: discoidin domain-containing protein [Desulfosudaceae bacterium]